MFSLRQRVMMIAAGYEDGRSGGTFADTDLVRLEALPFAADRCLTSTAFWRRRSPADARPALGGSGMSSGSTRQ